MELFTETMTTNQSTGTGAIRWKLMSKNTISAGFLTLACGDVIALSQFPLSLWEAVAFGVLCVTSYGLGLFAGLAE